jgi:3-hydroxybutyryl-CoA dehydrogenase
MPSTRPFVAALLGQEGLMSPRSIGIVGCGAMGTGIAEVAAVAGSDVAAMKITPGLLEDVSKRIDRSIEHGNVTAEAHDQAMARIAIPSDISRTEACDLVTESAIESLADKQRILSEVEPVVGGGSTIASNTPSIPLVQLAGRPAATRRFLGLHFFAPAPRMKLVELAPLATTGEDVAQRAWGLIERFGKVPVRTGADASYIVNRLLVPFLCHAIETLKSGVAAARDIDGALKLGCHHPMGPLALSDLIGLDVVLAMAQTPQSELEDRRFRPPSLLRRLVLAGHLGKKTGVGLYDYRGAEPVENPILHPIPCVEPAA